MEDRVTALVRRFAKLDDDGAGLTDAHTDLWAAGMSSLHSVSVMMAVEEEFGVEFPETMLTRATFSSVAAITRAVRSLGGEAAAVNR